MTTQLLAAPGWYPCPVDPDILRYFTGSRWTEETAQPGSAPAPAPVQPAYGQPGYAQQPYGQPGYAQQGYQPYAGVAPIEGHGPADALHWLVPVGRSGASIAAGYIGLVALVIWPAGPFAIGMGVWGLRKARTGGHGSGRSVFAIVAGALASALLGLYLAAALF